jgi:DNA repair protein RadC
MQSLLQVEGMGETAAEWICTLGRLSAAWGILRVHDPVIIDNYGKMYAYARKAAPEIKKPCCMQLLMDDHGRLIYRHILGDIPCRDEAHSRFLLHEALSDIFAMNVHSAALIIFVGKRVSYPSNFDRKFARDYARLLNLASVTPVDIVILGSTGAVSMRRLNMVPENLKYLKKNSLREKYISSLRPAKLKSAHYRFHTNRRMNYECTESL